MKGIESVSSFFSYIFEEGFLMVLAPFINIFSTECFYAIVSNQLITFVCLFGNSL